jgi:hypothetical protein
MNKDKTPIKHFIVLVISEGEGILGLPIISQNQKIKYATYILLL